MNVVLQRNAAGRIDICLGRLRANTSAASGGHLEKYYVESISQEQVLYSLCRFPTRNVVDRVRAFSQESLTSPRSPGLRLGDELLAVDYQR